MWGDVRRVRLGVMLLMVAALSVVVRGEAEPPGEFEPYTQEIPGTGASFEMVPIEGGTFTMGSSKGEKGRAEDEGPRFEVKVEPFWMGRYEVTWGEYRHFMEEYEAAIRRKREERRIPEAKRADAVSLPTPPYAPEAAMMYPGLESDRRFGGWTFDEDRPAAGMTQFAAKQFTKWLSRKTGHFYRLPTEAEWEYACRAGTQTAYHFGDNLGSMEDGFQKLSEYAWHFDNAEETTHPVGRKKPNAWGLHDMHGNAAEWVIDQYDPGWYGKMAERPQPVPAREAINWPTKEYPRVVRGGSWYHYPEEVRSAHRIASNEKWKQLDPEYPRSIWWHTDAGFVGFRIVQPLNEPSEEEKQRYWEPDFPFLKEYLAEEAPRDWSNEVRVLIDPGDDGEDKGE